MLGGVGSGGADGGADAPARAAAADVPPADAVRDRAADVGVDTADADVQDGRVVSHTISLAQAHDAVRAYKRAGATFPMTAADKRIANDLRAAMLAQPGATTQLLLSTPFTGAQR